MSKWNASSILPDFGGFHGHGSSENSLLRSRDAWEVVTSREAGELQFAERFPRNEIGSRRFHFLGQEFLSDGSRPMDEQLFIETMDTTIAQRLELSHVAQRSLPATCVTELRAEVDCR